METILVNNKPLNIKSLEDIEMATKARIAELKAENPTDDLYTTQAMYQAIYIGILQAQYEILRTSILY